MVIEITGVIERSSVFVSGETVSVAVTLTSVQKGTNGDSDEEKISWCSAQIHCLSAANETYVTSPAPTKPISPEMESSSPGTSFAPWKGESGSVVMMTKPTILACDLVLRSGQSKTVYYKETIPKTGPPSYRGHRIKYSWKVTVGVQKYKSKVSLLRLPLRVILLPPSPDVLDTAYSSSEEELTPSNPFLRPSPSSPNKEATPPSPLPALLQAWPARSTRAFNVVHSNGHVVKFSIFRSSYKLGDDILATLDFTNGQISCVQYSVCLQSVEEIKEEFRRRSKQTPSVLSYSKTHELCLSMSHTNLLLPVPLHITPAFSTDMVDLQYRLHFEFVLSTPKKDKVGDKKGARPSSSDSVENERVFIEDMRGPYESGTVTKLKDGTELWHAPREIDIETLVWDLPIHISPLAPSQLSAGLNIPQSCAKVTVE